MKKLIRLFYSEYYITCSLFIINILFAIIMGFIDLEKMILFFTLGLFLIYFVAFYLAVRISVLGRKVSQRPGVMRYLNEISKDVKLNRNMFYEMRNKLVKTGKIFHFLLLALSLLAILSTSLTIYIFEDDTPIMIIAFSLSIISFMLVIRSFFVNLKYDEFGAELTRNENSRIYKLVDSVCDEFGLDHIESIYVINISNVLIAYDLGRKQHVLRIGVHFLTNLSDDELRVILKHEAMHIKNNDTFNGAKSYQKMMMWRKMLTKGGLVFNSFANVYLIFINIYNDILSRFEEVNADKNIILNDKERQDMTSALVKSFFISEFYERLYYELRLFEYEKPVSDMVEKSIAGFSEFMIKHEERLLNKVKKIRSITYDTHLSILERLENLGVAKEDIKFEKCVNQANYDELKAVFPYINKEWEGLVINDWHVLNQNLKEGKKLIIDLADSNRVDDLINLGIAYERVFEFEKAMEVYQKAIQIDEKNLYANLRKGYLLLFNDDDRGIELVKNAIESKSEVANDAIETLLEYCYKNGMNDLVEELLVWSTDKLEQANIKLGSMNRITRKTKLVHHSLSIEDQKALDEICKGFIGIIKTHIAKKINQDQTEKIVILLECKKDLPFAERLMYQQKVADRLIDTIVFIGQRQFNPINKRIIKAATKTDEIK